MTVAPIAIWCEAALLPGGLTERVVIDIDAAGRFGSIVAGADPPPGAERRIGATVAGAANAHSHAFHRALRHRSQAGHGSFWTWRDQMYAVARSLDPERYHRLARAAFAEMAVAGYTTVGEFHYVHHRPGGASYASPNAMADAVTAAASDAGMRLTLLDTVYVHGGLGGDGYQPLAAEQRRFGHATFDEWVERVDDHESLAHRRVGAAVHSVRAVDPATIGEVARWAVEAEAPLHAHVSEQPAENEQCAAVHGCTPVELFARVGALGPWFSAVHATHLTDHDVALLGAAGASVCLCPTTERDLGDGIGPARRLADADVGLMIGSDSQAVVDPFAEARAIEHGERLSREERGLFGADELAAAMTAGHGALGWRDAGAIEVGRRADLVTVSMDTVRTAGAHPGSELEAIVHAATSADVTHVMIDGVSVAEHGRHRRIDVADELRAAIGALAS
jgi:formiminoglutamate deiminase